MSSFVENCDDCGLESNTYLQLHVVERTINQASLQLSWCLDKRVLDRLVESESVKNPQILISVVSLDKLDKGVFEKRYMFNLTDLMCFIPLEYSGKVGIFATIVWDGKENDFTMYAKSIFLRKTCGEYDTTIFSPEFLDNSSKLSIAPAFDDYKIQLSDDTLTPPSFIYSRININVPKEVFAKEPPQWLIQWANHFFDDKPYDECNFRRRFIFAFTVQPIMFAFIFFFRYVAVLFSLLCLRRGMNFRPLINPYMTWDQIWEDSELSFLPTWKSPFKVVLMPLIPIFWVPILSICIIFNFPILLALYMVVSAMLVPLIGLTIAFVIPGLYDRISKIKLRKDNNKPEQLESWYNDKNLETMTCSPGKKFNNVSELPKEYRTFKLRFQELKTKVCKPFVRS